MEYADKENTEKKKNNLKKNRYNGSTIWGLGGEENNLYNMVIYSWVTKTDLKNWQESSDTHIKLLTYFKWTSIDCGYNVADILPFSVT